MGLPTFTCSEETLQQIPSILREHEFTVSDHPRTAGLEGLLLGVIVSKGFRRVDLIASLRPRSNEIVLHILQARPVIDSRLSRDITKTLLEHGVSISAATNLLS